MPECPGPPCAAGSSPAWVQLSLQDGGVDGAGVNPLINWLALGALTQPLPWCGPFQGETETYLWGHLFTNVGNKGNAIVVPL